MSTPRPNRRPASVLQDLPPVWASSLEAVREQRPDRHRCLIVLDDDPMSGQALYDVPVVTTWNAIAISAEVRNSDAVVLLTDTRSMGREEAVRRMREIGECLREVASQTHYELDIALRGDSTLRGHFPADLDALLNGMLDKGAPRPVCIVAPYFGEAGRVTLDDTQYVVDGDTLVPAAETEYARDPAFRYKESHLPAWLGERSDGRIRQNQVASVSIETLRTGGPKAVAEKIGAVVHGRYVIGNAVDDCDLHILAEAMAMATDAGKRFVSFSAAPFVRVRAGMPPRPLLTRDEVVGEAVTTGGGLTIVGSYIERTREQVAYAIAQGEVAAIEMDVEDAIYNAKATIRERAADVEAALADGRDVILHLSKDKPPSGAHQALEAGQKLSRAFAGVLGLLQTRPRYVMVKGGNTASRVAIDGLHVRRATILGQLLSGVPVWRLGSESRWPEMPFVIFAGNVGQPESLREAIEKLRRD